MAYWGAHTRLLSWSTGSCGPGRRWLVQLMNHEPSATGTSRRSPPSRRIIRLPSTSTRCPRWIPRSWPHLVVALEGNDGSPRGPISPARPAAGAPGGGRYRGCIGKGALGTFTRAGELEDGHRPLNRRLAPLVLVILALEARCGVGPRSERRSTLQSRPSQSGSECPSGRRVVWRGDVSHAGWLQRWDPAATFLYGESNASLVEDARFEGVLRVAYPAGSSSSSYAREG